MPDILEEWRKKQAVPEIEEIDVLEDWRTQQILTEEPDILERWRKEQLATEPTWWERGWGFESIKAVPEQYGSAWMQMGTTMGQGATWLARFCPGQKDLPNWEEQSEARKALTAGQGISALILAGLIGYTGVAAIASLGKFLIYGRADRIAAKFATQHFDKIKAQNPQVKTIADAQALAQASLRGAVAPKAEVTYLPTTMRELSRLGERLLKPLAEATPTAEFKTSLIEQTNALLTRAGVKPTTEIMKPFLETIEHYVGTPTTGIITPEFGKAVIAGINEFVPSMIDAVKETGRAYLPFERLEVIPEEEIVEREIKRPLAPTPEKYAAPEVAPKAEIPEDLTLAMRDTETSEIIKAVEGEVIHTDMMARLGERYKDMEPGWVDSKGKFYDVWSGRRTLAGFEPIEEAKVPLEEPEILPEEIAPKVKAIKPPVPPSMEQEINTGGGPALGMGIELTKKELFTEPKEKNFVGKATDAIVRNLSVYTRVKKEFPEAYQAFREFKGGQELAWINAQEKNKEIWGKISQNEALAIQRHRQNPEKYPLEKLAKELHPAAGKLDETLEKYKEDFIDMGKMTEGWPQSYIEQLQKEKEKLLTELTFLKQKKAIAWRTERMEEINGLIQTLRDRRFFPGRYYDTPEGQVALAKFIPRGRFRRSQIRERWIKGKTIPDIDAAIEAGLEPLDPRAALLDYFYWAEIEKNKWTLYQGIKDNSNLAIKETKDVKAPDWWDDATGLPALKGYKINPIISDVLLEFEGTPTVKGIEAAYKQVARTGKIASFYNPLIMGGIYDPQQGLLAAGLRAWSPIRFARAVKGNFQKDEFYKTLVKMDLYPKPVDLGPQRNMDDLVVSAAKQMDEATPKFTAQIERLTDGQWNFKGGEKTKNMIKFMKGFYSAEWNMTWALDAASRRTTVEVLLSRDWELKDAVERARFYHADYGDIPASTRRFLNYAVWTPSYQIAMGKVYANMLRHPVKERGPLARLIAFQILVATGAAIVGYKWQAGHRFVKKISETEEEVITSPGPLYWMNKMFTRDPVVSAYWMSSVPVNIFLSVRENYDGLGGTVYDRKASKEVQIGQTATFIIQRYFRPLEAFRRLKDPERQLLDRLLHLVAISKYKRKVKKKPTGEKYWWR